MAKPEKEATSKKKKPSVRELEKLVYQLQTDLQAMQNEAGTFRRKAYELEGENDRLKLEKGWAENKLKNAQSRFSRLALLGFELKVNSFMRAIVVMTFAIMGPFLLLAYFSVDPPVDILLDIFKIWLGAAIGISTNLLQREEKSEKTLPLETETERKSPQPATEEKMNGT